MKGYPRWASSDTSGELLSGKSKWRPVPPFDRGRLAGQRRTPKVLEGFSSGS